MFTPILTSGGADLVDISMLNAGIIAALGYGVVFLGLIALMVVVMLIGKFFTKKAKKADEEKPVRVAVPVADPAAAAEPQTAPGSAGQLKLHDVPPKTAAMLMAIVADKLGKPLNELRFISIKEDKE